jgi:hypothetical protein
MGLLKCGPLIGTCQPWLRVWGKYGKCYVWLVYGHNTPFQSLHIIKTNPNKFHTLLEEDDDLWLETKNKVKRTNKEYLDPFRKSPNDHSDDPYIWKYNPLWRMETMYLISMWHHNHLTGMRAKQGIRGIIDHMSYGGVNKMCGYWLEIYIMG